MTKIKCLLCGDVLQGDEKGTFKECKCRTCYIDETEDYCRIGGNEKYFEIEEDNIIDLKPTIPVLLQHRFELLLQAYMSERDKRSKIQQYVINLLLDNKIYNEYGKEILKMCGEQNGE